jgi:hypothetical protein
VKQRPAKCCLGLHGILARQEQQAETKPTGRRSRGHLKQSSADGFRLAAVPGAKELINASQLNGNRVCVQHASRSIFALRMARGTRRTTRGLAIAFLRRVAHLASRASHARR